jgi:amino acid transporter
MFLVLGNLAGNAVYIGQYVMLAARGSYPTLDGLGPADAGVIGIAICALTLSVLMHIFSRRGGIIINNLFAVVKVCLLFIVVIIGFINYGYATAGRDGPKGWHTQPNITVIEQNFSPSFSMKTQGDANLAGDGSRYVLAQTSVQNSNTDL